VTEAARALATTPLPPEPSESAEPTKLLREAEAIMTELESLDGMNNTIFADRVKNMIGRLSSSVVLASSLDLPTVLKAIVKLVAPSVGRSITGVRRDAVKLMDTHAEGHTEVLRQYRAALLELHGEGTKQASAEAFTALCKFPVTFKSLAAESWSDTLRLCTKLWFCQRVTTWHGV
jgi:hypothetical protein